MKQVGIIIFLIFLFCTIFSFSKVKAAEDTDNPVEVINIVESSDLQIENPLSSKFTIDSTETTNVEDLPREETLPKEEMVTEPIIVESGFAVNLLEPKINLEPVEVSEVSTDSDVKFGDIIISELMWMGSSASDSDEWIELYNNTSNKIDLSNWQITKLSSGGAEELMLTIPSGKSIGPNEHFLISNYGIGSSSILNIVPDLISSAISLSNSKLKIGIYNGSFNDGALAVDFAGNGGLPLAGLNDNSDLSNPKRYSMVRNEIFSDGTKKENWHTATESLNFLPNSFEKGTPERSINKAPSIPLIQSPLINGKIIKGENINFSWTASLDPEGEEVSYSLYLGCSENFSETDLLDSALEEINYLKEDGVTKNCEEYFWKVVVSDGSSEVESAIGKFKIIEPVYNDKIIINELFPDPAEDEATGEWIEIYNDSDEDVNLKNWYLEDTLGTTHKFIIEKDIFINAKSYLAFYRSFSGITLNNSSDGIKLHQPNGNLLSESPEFKDGKEGWAWARKSDGDWSWTIKPTPNLINVINSPKIEEEEDAVGGDAEEVILPINSIPIEIKTGDYKSYEEKLVTVKGNVSETSGNTFWLDDGSGPVKIYIQAKTNIDKPKMRKGDLVEVVGVVNIYRQSWRILPRNQEDIKILQSASAPTSTSQAAVKKTSSTSSSKSTAAKAVSTKVTKTSGGTSPPKKEIKGDSALQTIAPPVTKDIVVPFWIQMIKTITGLTLVLLVVLIIKIFKLQPRHKIIGGNFGDDET